MYFYDTGYIQADEGIKLENTCANCLLKHVHFLRDIGGIDADLHYIRIKTGQEVDFAISANKALSQLIEVKLASRDLSPVLYYFSQKYPGVSIVQLVHNMEAERNVRGISIIPCGQYLGNLSA